MHREEFTNTLLKDEFIDALITQIKTIAKELKIEEIHFLLSHIEDDPMKMKGEMTRFSAFLFTQLKSLIESDCDYEDNSRSNSNSSETLKTNIQTKSQANSNSKYYTTNNTSFDNYENSSSPNSKVKKIANDIGIDELVEYIQKPEGKKIKKNKKKKKNKKSEMVESVTSKSEEDEEVEKFKKLI